MSQADIVLRELRHAGARGMHTFELRGMYIANPSQRILELESRGHAISHTREKLHGTARGCRYRLVRDADLVAPSLFDKPKGEAA